MGASWKACTALVASGLLAACDSRGGAGFSTVRGALEPGFVSQAVDCSWGDGFDEVGELGPPGHWYGVRSRATDSSTGVTKDGGRTWSRVPLLSDERVVAVAGGGLVVTGEKGQGVRRYLVDDALATHELAFVNDAPASLPAGAWVARHTSSLWVGVTLEGWLRTSVDAGATWRGSSRARLAPKDSDQPVRFEATRGDRIVLRGTLPLQSGSEDRVIQYSTDGGHTFRGLAVDTRALATNPDALTFGLSGESGITILVDAAERFALVSGDHGATWSTTPLDAYTHALHGPGAGEVWIREGSGRVIYTADAGRTWREVRFQAGAKTLVVRSLAGITHDASGRNVLHLGAEDGARTCTFVDSGGADRVPGHVRDDTPGSLQPWLSNGGIPMPQPGVPGVPSAYFNPAASGLSATIVDAETDASGDLYVLLDPVEGVDRGSGPAQQVWRFEGRDPARVKAKWKFDNLREPRGPQSTPSPYYLRATDLQVLPDGELRLHVPFEGNFSLTTAPAIQAPYTGFRGRWGDAEGGLAYVSATAPGNARFNGVLERHRDTNPPSCFGDDDGERDCFVMRDGGIRDFAVHQGHVWVLDRLNGALWRRPIDGRTGAWTKVLDGLLDAIELRHTFDPGDPGMFVLDQVTWWRVVPGPNTVRRVR